jgi:ABC-type sugar transport system ATPase subunit
VTAVHDANLEIRDQEFVVLVGPSGCGKSTTLRMVAGLEDISRGSIYIDGKKVNDIPPKDRDIAMVFQNYALYPHMSVYNNMAFGLKLRKYPKAEIHKRVMEAAEILGIVDYLERKPKALSGGQRQRVAVGRAIVRKPKAFLFDEPLSNLDAKMRVQMRAEISKLHNSLKSTMIYVTHDQIEAMTMGDRIVVMKDGWIQQVDTPLNIYNHPANQFVAGFIGSPPMNFFRGTIVTEGQRGVLRRRPVQPAAVRRGRQQDGGVRRAVRRDGHPPRERRRAFRESRRRSGARGEGHGRGGRDDGIRGLSLRHHGPNELHRARRLLLPQADRRFRRGGPGHGQGAFLRRSRREGVAVGKGIPMSLAASEFIQTAAVAVVAFVVLTALAILFKAEAAAHRKSGDPPP